MRPIPRISGEEYSVLTGLDQEPAPQRVKQPSANLENSSTDSYSDRGERGRQQVRTGSQFNVHRTLKSFNPSAFMSRSMGVPVTGKTKSQLMVDPTKLIGSNVPTISNASGVPSLSVSIPV